MQTRLCSICKKPVVKRTGVHYEHRLTHKWKCLDLATFFKERKVKCQECGRENPKFFGIMQGLEVAFCNIEHAQMFKEKDRLRTLMEAVQ